MPHHQTTQERNNKMGIHPIDPLRFTTLNINQGRGPVRIKLNFKDIDLHGLSKVTLQEFKNDWKVMSIKAKLGRLELIGGYTISGRVLILPIAGTGKTNITLIDQDIKVVLKVKQVTKGEKSYVNVESFDFTFTPKRTHFHFENLFNGDEALGDHMNLFLKENHEEIMNELKPTIAKALSEGFKQVSNQIFSKLPANEIMLK